MKRSLHRSRAARAALTAATLVLSGCGNSRQSVDPGPQPTVEGERLEVVYESSTVSVDLAALATTTYKGMAVVLLSDVWAASELAVDHTTLEFGFEADDGFSPAGKGCADLPGVNLDSGYINPSSRNLAWDESLGLRGCYSVDSAKRMTGHLPSGGEDAGGG